MEPGVIIVIAIIAVVAVIVILSAISRLLLISQPNEAIILSGSKRKTATGDIVGFRIIRGGRAMRKPFVERASKMSLETIPIDLSVKNAYSKGGIPLVVDAIANIKIDSKEPAFGNAVERFLNMKPDQIHQIAKDTLEGNLRGVLASLTPEEVNEDRMKFAESLMEEAETDLQKLGLQLDTLKITNISDERGYLDSIGRMKTAEVIKSAEKAEADNKSEAEEAKALALKRAEVAKAKSEQDIKSAEIEKERAVQIANAKAQQEIEIEKNSLRIKKAELEKIAIIKEKEAEVSGQKAQVQYEQEVEEERIKLQQRRLMADIIEPAKAKKEAMELEALGVASKITADGEAKLQVLKQTIETYNAAQGNGDKVIMLNMLPQITEILASTIKGINIDKITMVDSGNGDGSQIQKLVNQLPGAVVNLTEMIENATGVDILSSFKKKES